MLFVVAETADARHTLAGIDLASGAVVLRRPLPPPQGEEIAYQQRAALTALDGWVYVAYGGLDGDCSDYVGSVVAAPTVRTGPLRSYATSAPCTESSPSPVFTAVLCWQSTDVGATPSSPDTSGVGRAHRGGIVSARG